MPVLEPAQDLNDDLVQCLHNRKNRGKRCDIFFRNTFFKVAFTLADFFSLYGVKL